MSMLTAVLAARRHYVDGATKSEIAGELGVSRFKVARLLDTARREGIVRIEIGVPPEVDLELSTELAARHGLRGAIVVRRGGGDAEFTRGQLGHACAELLTQTLDTSDVVGISWGRTLHAMVEYLGRLPACTVVQIVGNVPTLELNVNSTELVRRVAERAGGPVFPLHVPLVVDTSAMADALRRDPHVSRTTAMFDRLTRAFVGIGGWTAGESTVREALPEALVADLDAAGATADICSIILDGNGRQIERREIPGRFIAIRADQLRAVPDVVGIAGGAVKAPAILGAVRSGLIHRLITDDEAARLLLAA